MRDDVDDDEKEGDDEDEGDDPVTDTRRPSPMKSSTERGDEAPIMPSPPPP